MKRVRHLALAAAALAAAPAAAVQGGAGFTPLDEQIQMQFRYNSQIEAPRYEAIRDDGSWRDLWLQMTAGRGPRPLRPQVNFDREMLLVAAMGTQRTGGYTIRISSVRETRAELVATVVRTSPGRRCGTTAALTEPADIVRVRATAKPVRWVYRDVVHRCP